MVPGLICMKGAGAGGLLLALVFLQPEALLQNHPRMEETEAKEREGGQEGPASPRAHTGGTAEGKRAAVLGSPQTCSDTLGTEASTGPAQQLALCTDTHQPRAMTVHLCSPPHPTTLPAPGGALPARGQRTALSGGVGDEQQGWQGTNPPREAPRACSATATHAGRRG